MLASLKAFLMGGGSLTPSRALSAVVPLQIRAQCQVPAVPTPAQVTVGGTAILFLLKLNHASRPGLSLGQPRCSHAGLCAI